MAINTPQDLIALSLRTAGVIGIGQTPDSQDTEDCFSILNAMMSQWNRKRYLIFHLVDTACTMTGDPTYTVGLMQDLNVARTDAIDSAYMRWLPAASTPSSPVDYPIAVLKSGEDFSRIALKTMQGPAQLIYYDAAMPNGIIHIYPVPPDNSQELHILTKETLSQFASLTTQINLPPEYINCLIWNLATRIRPLFQLPPEQSITALAIDSLTTIRGANNQIPSLQTPRDLAGRGSSYWNGYPFGWPG